MNQLVYFFVFLLSAPLLFSFWVEGLGFIESNIGSPALTWFWYGLLTAALSGAILDDAVTRFIGTAVHELTHAFVGLLFLKRVTYMEAKSEGKVRGLTSFEGGHNPFVALAPYYFPLLALPFLLAKPVISHLDATINHVVDLLIGLTLGFHYVLHVTKFRFSQQDLKSVGPIVSIGLTHTLILIFLVIIVAVVLGEYDSLLNFFTDTLARSPEYYRTALAWLQSAWEQLRPQLGA